MIKDDAIGQAIDALRVNALRFGNKDLEAIADKAHEELIALRVGMPSEPKPCEDAVFRAWGTAIDVLMPYHYEPETNSHTIPNGKIETAARLIALYASQVADKRSEELRNKGDVCELVAGEYREKDCLVTLRIDNPVGCDVIIGALYYLYRSSTLDEALAATEPKP